MSTTGYNIVSQEKLDSLIQSGNVVKKGDKYVDYFTGVEFRTSHPATSNSDTSGITQTNNEPAADLGSDENTVIPDFPGSKELAKHYQYKDGVWVNIWDGMPLRGQDEEKIIESVKRTKAGITFDGAPDPKKEATEKKPKKQPEFKKQGGILRYPLEGMTQHTDYLQIDIVEYKPVGSKLDRVTRQPSKDSLEWAKKNPEKAKAVDGGRGVGPREFFKAKSSNFISEPGNRRNTINNTGASRTRPFGLATKPLINAGTILLPIPSNVQDGNAVKFGDNSLNGLQAAGASAIMNLMTTNVNQENLATKIGEVSTKFAEKAKSGVGSIDMAKTVALSKLTATAVNIFGGNITTAQLLSRQEGLVINPNMELLFDGPTLRAFKFQFKMTPRNEREARQCKLIIRAFKRNMAPITQGTGSWFLRTPNVFELRYRTGNKDHPFLHKFKQCFLTDVAVNYTGEGVYSTYDDATPTSMLLDLSFKELEPIYDIDYDSPEGATAVGY